MENKKNLLKAKEKLVKGLLEDSTTFLVSTDLGTSAYGSTPDLLSLLASVIKALREYGVKDESIKRAIDLAFMNKEDLMKELKSSLKELIDKIGE